MLTREQRRRLDSLAAYDWCEEGEDSDAILRALVASMDSPEELWFAVIAKVWDLAENELDPILDHPLCDRGIALMIYWCSAPHYYWQREKGRTLDEHEMKSWTAIKRLEERLLTGYSDEKIAFDPTEFVQRFGKAPEVSCPGARLIPELLKRPTHGAKLPLFPHSSFESDSRK
jgi:hypothetical protein